MGAEKIAMANDYDAMPFRNVSIPDAHPDRLATIANLFGHRAPPVATARVLELGCACGDNVLALAVALPDAKFVGIDLSEGQIAEARTAANAVGVENVAFEVRDLCTIDASFGQFEYILAPGLYSWVPSAVQERALAVCRDALAPGGVVYMAYNCLPGWRMSGAIRDMLIHHAGRFADPKERVRQARAFLDFLVRWTPDRRTTYATLLRAEAESLRGKEDWYIFHEHLEPHNEALYLTEFVRRAEAAGLDYLGDARLATMFPYELPRPAVEAIRMMAPDPLGAEQYLDFVRNATFRQSLLRRAGGPPRDLRPQTISGLWVSADPTTPVVADPTLQAARKVLAERWPRAMPTEELRQGTLRALGGQPSAANRDLAPPAFGATLLGWAIREVIELHTTSPPVASEISERPKASPLARLQAKRGLAVANLRNRPVLIEERDRRLLLSLDGETDRASLDADGLRRLHSRSLLMA